MNSIRPLITITILAVVGAWLYVKINEGPARPAHDEADAFHDHAADGVPPLAATTNAPSTDAGPAPAWPTSAAPAPQPATLQPAPATVSTNGLPEMPAIPALPDVSTLPPTAANSVPVNLPADIPSARYPDAGTTTGDGSAVSPGGPMSSAPLLNAGPDSVAISSVPNASQTPTADHESTIATDNAMAAVGLTPQIPLAQQPAPGIDRYGLSATNPVDTSIPDATAPVEPTFTAAWPEIQTALDRGELARAHQLLSKWYGDDSLSPAEAERLELLLGQLAGTVVYSTENQLEPAYIVKPGDTLGSIAQQCNVPWQLLAKINGITSVDAVQPGQSLKVLRGPFSAVVDLRRSQLTLMLDGRYAGKFPIVVPTGAVVDEGQWLVDQKLNSPSSGVTQTAYAPAQVSVECAIVLRGEDASTGKPAAAGPTLTIAGGSSPTGPAANTPAIRVSPQDAAELSDILSIGSRVVVQR
ncbi:MAG: LysM peptidoglycan-binding domain-containing protein [Pirellulales bacterium]